MAEKKPMKGEAPDAKWPIRFPLYASVKLDGIRILMDGLNPRSSTMKRVPNTHINRLLTGKPELVDLDMEAVMGVPEDPLCYSRTFSAYTTIEGEPDIHFYVFDIVDQTLPFYQRQRMLLTRSMDFPHYVKVVEQVLIESQQELDELYAQVTEAGHEGLILRSPEGMYKYGRATAKSQDCLKLKPQEDFEFAIVDFYEAMENTNEAFTNELGRTARSSHAEGKVGKGTLGGFIGRRLSDNQEFRCAPGKLTHEERQTIWNDRDAYRGHIGKCRHFPVGLMVNNMPRHGRWIGWRAPEDM